VTCALLLQYATAGAPNGVDALYLFRSQRMLQHKNVDIWERATQIDSPGERLEIGFADLYPQKLPANWKRPKVDIKSPVQNGVRKVISRPAAVSAASDTNEGEMSAVLWTASFKAQFCCGISLAVAVHILQLWQFSIMPLRWSVSTTGVLMLPSHQVTQQSPCPFDCFSTFDVHRVHPT